MACAVLEEPSLDVVSEQHLVAFVIAAFSFAAVEHIVAVVEA